MLKRKYVLCTGKGHNVYIYHIIIHVAPYGASVGCVGANISVSIIIELQQLKNQVIIQNSHHEESMFFFNYFKHILVGVDIHSSLHLNLNNNNNKMTTVVVLITKTKA
jgi:hypothetical protein